jgi:hypothetical protein
MRKDVMRDEPGSLKLVDWICLAATPAFAVMALVTGVGGGMPGMPDMGSPLNGMAAMYVLMSVFHSTPWLKLISSRRNAPQPITRNQGV